MKFIKLFLIFIFISLVFYFPKVGVAADKEEKPSVYAVKAAFLYNFAKFIEWPREENEEFFLLTILGKDPFGNFLDDLQDKLIKGKKIRIKRIGSLKEINSPHMLFISPSEKNQLKKIIKSLEKSAILTVGETEEFCQQGGMINFYLDQNKVRFEINNEAAKKVGLRIHSRLLKLARIVKETN